MPKDSTQIRENPVTQGSEEEIYYNLTTTPWGADPTNSSVKIYSVVGGGEYEDKTPECMPGTPTISGDVITLPVIKSLVEGVQYRVEIKFTAEGQKFEAHATVNAIR